MKISDRLKNNVHLKKHYEKTIAPKIERLRIIQAQLNNFDDDASQEVQKKLKGEAQQLLLSVNRFFAFVKKDPSDKSIERVLENREVLSEVRNKAITTLNDSLQRYLEKAKADYEKTTLEPTKEMKAQSHKIQIKIKEIKAQIKKCNDNIINSNNKNKIKANQDIITESQSQLDELNYKLALNDPSMYREIKYHEDVSKIFAIHAKALADADHMAFSKNIRRMKLLNRSADFGFKHGSRGYEDIIKDFSFSQEDNDKWNNHKNIGKDKLSSAHRFADMFTKIGRKIKRNPLLVSSAIGSVVLSGLTMGVATPVFAALATAKNAIGIGGPIANAISSVFSAASGPLYDKTVAALGDKDKGKGRASIVTDDQEGSVKKTKKNIRDEKLAADEIIVDLATQAGLIQFNEEGQNKHIHSDRLYADELNSTLFLKSIQALLEAFPPGTELTSEETDKQKTYLRLLNIDADKLEQEFVFQGDAAHHSLRVDKNAIIPDAVFFKIETTSEVFETQVFEDKMDSDLEIEQASSDSGLEQTRSSRKNKYNELKDDEHSEDNDNAVPVSDSESESDFEYEDEPEDEESSATVNPTTERRSPS